MKIVADEYEQFRQWLTIVSPAVFRGINNSPETSPILVLDKIAAKSRAKARQGLAMAIGDIIEATSDWRGDRILEIDRRLCEASLPSLTEIRMRFSRAIQAVLRRGRIRSEREYNAVRNAVEGTGRQEDKMLALLAAYEAGVKTTRRE